MRLNRESQTQPNELELIASEVKNKYKSKGNNKIIWKQKKSMNYRGNPRFYG